MPRSQTVSAESAAELHDSLEQLLTAFAGKTISTKDLASHLVHMGKPAMQFGHLVWHHIRERAVEDAPIEFVYSVTVADSESRDTIFHFAAAPADTPKLVPSALEAWAALRGFESETDDVEQHLLQGHLEGMGISTRRLELSTKQLADRFAPVCDFDACTSCVNCSSHTAPTRSCLRAPPVPLCRYGEPSPPSTHIG